MTEQQFNEACKYANSKLEEWRVKEALDLIKLRMQMPAATADKLTDAMDEWSKDNNLGEDEWLEWGDAEDVFFNEE